MDKFLKRAPAVAQPSKRPRSSNSPASSSRSSVACALIALTWKQRVRERWTQGGWAAALCGGAHRVLQLVEAQLLQLLRLNGSLGRGPAGRRRWAEAAPQPEQKEQGERYSRPHARQQQWPEQQQQ